MYTLGGPDMDAVQGKKQWPTRSQRQARLDYETKSEYTVIVTATDSSDATNKSASITVTIHVTDLGREAGDNGFGWWCGDIGAGERFSPRKQRRRSSKSKVQCVGWGRRNGCLEPDW